MIFLRVQFIDERYKLPCRPKHRRSANFKSSESRAVFRLSVLSASYRCCYPVIVPRTIPYHGTKQNKIFNIRAQFFFFLLFHHINSYSFAVRPIFVITVHGENCERCDLLRPSDDVLSRLFGYYCRLAMYVVSHANHCTMSKFLKLAHKFNSFYLNGKCSVIILFVFLCRFSYMFV